jgi:hypothetical protein
MVYPWVLFFVKASILALYHRIFTQTKFRRAVYCVAGFVTIQTIVVTFVNVRQSALLPPSLLTPPGLRMQHRTLVGMDTHLSRRLQQPPRNLLLHGLGQHPH